mmetsp:Transcript_4473/g.5517  ORF Transcript_4473/g.5517 Transcript_4473/m.5517 type:complete len:116 (+) Transcript_4473:779-1126(+)
MTETEEDIGPEAVTEEDTNAVQAENEATGAVVALVLLIAGTETDLLVEIEEEDDIQGRDHQETTETGTIAENAEKEEIRAEIADLLLARSSTKRTTILSQVLKERNKNPRTVKYQ